MATPQVRAGKKGNAAGSADRQRGWETGDVHTPEITAASHRIFVETFHVECPLPAVAESSLGMGPESNAALGQLARKKSLRVAFH
jgi:hypothetical protein